MRKIETDDSAAGSSLGISTTPTPPPAPASAPNRAWIVLAAVIVCLVIAAVLKQ